MLLIHEGPTLHHVQLLKNRYFEMWTSLAFPWHIFYPQSSKEVTQQSQSAEVASGLSELHKKQNGSSGTTPHNW